MPFERYKLVFPGLAAGKQRVRQHAAEHDAQQAREQRERDVQQRYAVAGVVDKVDGLKAEGRQRGEAAQKANRGEVFPNGRVVPGEEACQKAHREAADGVDDHRGDGEGVERVGSR